MKRILIAIGLVIAACAAAPHARVQPRRLGAIVDGGIVDGSTSWVILGSDGGPTSVQPPFGDSPVVQLTAVSARVALDTCAAEFVIDDGNRRHVVTGQIGPVVCQGIITQAKNQTAAQFNVTLQ